LVVLIALLAIWATLDRLLVPSLRWYFRRRVHRVLEEFDARLLLRVQPFKLTKRQVLIDRLTYDPEVVEAAEEYAESEQMPHQVAMDIVGRYSREIVPAFNAYIYFRFGYWLSRKIARTLYRVRLGASDEEGLAEIAPDSTVVFVMNHRSNMDYVLVSYLAAEKTALSYAVGEWARIWPLETLLRSMGAYFVRRRSRDALYRKVLQRYVETATQQGVTQAVFPEGGLSRDGRLQNPKLGLLDYMLRSFDPAGARDMVFVPVGINYDRVLEDRTLLLDVEPGAERRRGWAAVGTTIGFLSRNFWLMLRGRWYRFGYACVNFGTPISARQYLSERDLDLRRLNRSSRFEKIEDLAAAIMREVGRVVPVLPVSLVARVLSHQSERPFSELELKVEVQSLIQRLEHRGGHVYVPREDRDYAIIVGLRMLILRRAVEEADGLYRAAPDQLALLRYYANSVAHLLD
jgi:glycerol-3-phosphate O-acyltransferase